MLTALTAAPARLPPLHPGISDHAARLRKHAPAFAPHFGAARGLRTAAVRRERVPGQGVANGVRSRTVVPWQSLGAHETNGRNSAVPRE